MVRSHGSYRSVAVKRLILFVERSGSAVKEPESAAFPLVSQPQPALDLLFDIAVVKSTHVSYHVGAGLQPCKPYLTPWSEFSDSFFRVEDRTGCIAFPNYPTLTGNARDGTD